MSDGMSGLPEPIIRRAMAAVKRQLSLEEQPEVVMVCDQLVYAAAIKIPGLQKAAIVAQSEDDVPGIQVTVPCVIGVPDLLRAIPNESIVIVDADNGEIIVDPTAEMLVAYQKEIDDRPDERAREPARRKPSGSYRTRTHDCSLCACR